MPFIRQTFLLTTNSTWLLQKLFSFQHISMKWSQLLSYALAVNCRSVDTRRGWVIMAEWLGVWGGPGWTPTGSHEGNLLRNADATGLTCLLQRLE